MRPARPHRGRPPDGDATRSEVLPIRLTPSERHALEEGAKRAGLGLGPWLRSLGMREAQR